MPETRHRTVLEVAVDDRGLRQMGPTLERALNPRVAETFEKSVERTTMALQKLVEQQTKLGRALDDQQRKNSRSARENETRERRQDERTRRATARGSFAGTMGANMVSGAFGGAQHVAQNLPVREGFLGQLVSSIIPILGPAFASVVGGAQSFYGSYVSQQQSRMHAFGSTGLGNQAYGRGGQGLGALGRQFGMGPAELPGFLSQYAGSAGLRGGSVGAGAPQALALQSLLGVGVGEQGALQNAVMTGSGAGEEARSRQVVVDAIEAGMVAGVRDARLGEMLQQIGAGIQEMRTHGVMINAEDVLGLVRGLGGMGGAFRGEAGTAAARSIASGMSSAPDQQSMISALAIRQRMQEHGEDYETAARTIEQNPTEAFRGVMGSLSQFRGTRGYETMLRNQLRGVGIHLSRQQAHELAGQGPEAFGDRMQPATGGGGALNQMLDEQRGQAPLGIPQAEAAYESRRAALGGRTAGLTQHYRGTEMHVIERLLPQMSQIADRAITLLDQGIAEFEHGGAARIEQSVDDAQRAASDPQTLVHMIADAFSYVINNTVANLATAMGFGGSDSVAQMRRTARDSWDRVEAGEASIGSTTTHEAEDGTRVQVTVTPGSRSGAADIQAGR